MKFGISPIIIGALLVFLIAPWIPNGVIKVLAGNPIGVFILLALCLVVVSYNVIDGIAVFLACGVLFLENRKRTLSRVEKGASGDNALRKSTYASVESLSVPADDLIDGEVHPVHDTPSEDESSFNPKDGSGSNKFDPVDDTINEKIPPETISGSAENMANKFIRDGSA